jgi:hypothetical protein
MAAISTCFDTLFDCGMVKWLLTASSTKLFVTFLTFYKRKGCLTIKELRCIQHIGSFLLLLWTSCTLIPP